MINVEKMSQKEIERMGMEVLMRELGPVGLIRFMQLFAVGQGDYTAERQDWLGRETVDDIVARIQQRRVPKRPTDN